MNHHHDHHAAATDASPAMHEHAEGAHCANCGPKNRQRIDWLLWLSGALILLGYGWHLFAGEDMGNGYLMTFGHSVYDFINTIWWGILLGIVFVGILAGVPRTLVTAVIGKGGTFNGIVRATLGGVLLDLCSHGILMIGTQLYKRGASLGQTMAFLIASPWNSLSLTLILWSLVGLGWTLALLILSIVIALVSGMIFDRLEANGTLPKNPHAPTQPEHAGFRKEFGAYWRGIRWSPASFVRTIKTGLKESEMVLRWIFFGIVLAALLRTFIPADLFAQLFGPSVLGLLATLLFATVLEVCSEGSVPVAVDFLLRAHAPGNMFAFLMAGVSTDYTEIMVLKETTRSWKISLFLPLITFPQILLIALVLNRFG